ncbi:hypothetical protein BOX15_Mlig028018g1 [Macrostomum lignano]|uniref:K Homology domain-containing protein n=2 Tax=Macrostomum lignano TaxID=282301 RepID=A0A267FGL5_9PLAT|nr:hypothetical protein BOX15_Mlig028018g1 [Macrostomum lignano]
MDTLDNHQDGITASASVQLYSEAFPPLATGSSTELNGNHWPKAPSKIAPIKTSVTTQIVEISFEERRFKDTQNEFGSDQNKICAQVQQEHEVKIEISNNVRARSLTLLVTGRFDKVSNAVSELRKRLQTQAQSEVTVPAEFHRHLIGKQGGVLKEIKLKSGCEIFIPRENDANPNSIRLIGPKENIDKARHEILCIYDEVSKKATERLVIPKIYHPFIAGPYNRQLEKIMTENGVRVNIPPVHAQHDVDIVRVSGEKDGVVNACRIIRQLYQDALERCQTVNIEVSKSLHKFVIGPRGAGLQEILEATGVSVEVPPAEDPSETIVLRGEGTKLGVALTKVYEKADSYATCTVLAPTWMHRHLIGPGGENLQKVVGLPTHKAQINFLRGEDKIEIDGPKEQVVVIHKNLKAWVDDYVKRNTMVEVAVPREFHRHIIGKSGGTVNKIRETTGCTVRVPADIDGEDVVRIEGERDKVNLAREELMQIVNKQANERSKDLIIEHQFHRALIGQGGAKIAEIRDKYPDVLIKFPNADQNSDVVQLRGPRDQLANVEKLLKKAHTDLRDSSYEEKVRIGKAYHKDIIGRKGQTIAKIREETNTRIIMPDSGSQSDVITVVGKQKDVQKAVRQINDIEKVAANIVEEVVEIPARLHQGLIGHGGKLIRQLQDQHSGVRVHFPPASQPSDRVTVRGPKTEVKKAKAALQQLAEERLEDSQEAVIHAKPEFHPFLIGRQGQNAEQLRKATGARLVFPSLDERGKEGGDIITIIGRKEAVAKAKEMLEKQVKDLENTTEESVEVDPRWHKAFMERRGFYITQISQDFGGVQLSFPREPGSSRVVVKGPKDCVQGAIARIREIVDDLAARVTIEVAIPAIHHRSVIGRSGDNVRDICDQFDVSIKFPEFNRQQSQPSDANAAPAAAEVTANGGGENAAASGSETSSNPEGSGDATPSKADLVSISGRQEQCDKARQALLDLVPIEEQLDFPSEFHGQLIGRNGEGIRRLTNELNMAITIPSKAEHIVLNGTPKRVEAAKIRLQERLKELEAEKADQEARSFECKLDIPAQYHREIIGPKGANVRALQQKYEVRVNIPNPDKNSNEIVVIGYQDKAEAAAKELMAIKDKLENQVSAELFITHQVHPIIIGQRGKNLRSLVEKFDVAIDMPGRNAPSDAQNTVVVRGAQADVDNACDHLLDLAGEVIDRMIERGELDPRSLRPDAVSEQAEQPAQAQQQQQQQQPQKQGKKQQQHGGSGPGFVVRDAPWDQQQLASSEHFPSIGGGNGGPAPPPASGNGTAKPSAWSGPSNHN